MQFLRVHKVSSYFEEITLSKKALNKKYRRLHKFLQSIEFSKQFMYWLNFGVDHFICCIKLLELLFPAKLIANLFYFHERITDED